MPYSDLREFLEHLEKEGELARVKTQVDPNHEVGAIMRRVFDGQGKAVIFENIKGHSIPLLCGALATYRRYSLGIECQPDIKAILERTIAAAQNPIPPRMVKSGPCQEKVITGDKIDLSDFPVPIWHELDGGPYIGTLGLAITKDPDTGARNVGIYREQILGKNRTGIKATQQVGMILKKYRDRGSPMPIATVFGVDPALLAASCIHLPPGDEEFAAAGALMGEPYPLVKCKTVDLEVPATAEIVLEGEVPPDIKEWKEEGPFGEFTGYYGGVVRRAPNIVLKAITTRANPIYQATLEGRPPSESTTLRAIGHTTGAWLRLKARVPGFKACWLTDMGCAFFIMVISLEKQYYLGNARQAILSYWSMSHLGKWVIVVDDDIDIFDRSQVEWALATRVQPHRDIIISGPNHPGTDLDPSIPPEDRPYPNTRCSRIGIDATKEFKGFEFPSEIRCRPEDIARVEARWQEYGIE